MDKKEKILNVLKNKGIELSDDVLDTVVGGFEDGGSDFDSLQMLDELVACQNSGDLMGMLEVIAIICGNLSKFYADVEKAGREIPETLREFLPH